VHTLKQSQVAVQHLRLWVTQITQGSKELCSTAQVAAGNRD
jgi:hypothetical protein